MNPSTRNLALLACAGLCAPSVSANTPQPLEEELPAPEEPAWKRAFLEGEMWLQLRYRYELVDEDGFMSDAYASTLRTALGYRTADFHGFRGMVEFEDVSVIGNELYDSGSNGVTDRPKVVDPDETEINRAALEYLFDEHNEVVLGRQYIKLDNERFVGSVSWRQNWQTFDSAAYRGKNLGQFSATYAYVDNVNTVAATNEPMSSNLLNAGYDFGEPGALTAYFYNLDYKSLDAKSANTFGLSFAGAPELGDDWVIDYRLEYANQQDTADNPGSIDADYLHAVLGGKIAGFRLGVGYEVLGGSGMVNDSFKTPLGTNHAFNGWADKFLSTPDDGLKDLYAALGYGWGTTKLAAVYHDFRSDANSRSYGSEIDLLAKHKLSSGIEVGLKFAGYDADTFSTDTTKGWIWVAFAF
jgi:hypothetical protein